MSTSREQYLAAVNAPGAFQAVEWVSTVKPAAAHKARTLTKVTKATVRTGIAYENMAVNADVETGSLPWGTWSEYPYLVEHKSVDYGRLYVSDNHPIRTTYLVDGEQVARDEFLALLTPSARQSSRPNGGTITVRLENLALR